MKNVVIYWCEFRGRQGDLLSFLGSKKKVYLEVFDLLSKENKLALVFGSKNYLGSLEFKNYYLYKNGTFEKKNQVISADAVLDRSRDLNFPQGDIASLRKVLNSIDFKELASDKWLFYQHYSRYSPKTFLCNDSGYLVSFLAKINTSKIVLKPRYGLKGMGIRVVEKDQVDASSIKFPVLLQEFVETKGLFGNSDSRHDIRVVVIDGVPVYSVLRQPPGDGFLANVAQGASIEQVMLSDLPEEILDLAKAMAIEIKKKYHNPFYAIDFGLTQSGPIIFELNNFIGFPLIERDHDLFVNNLVRVLLEKANIET